MEWFCRSTHRETEVLTSYKYDTLFCPSEESSDKERGREEERYPGLRHTTCNETAP